MVSVLLSTSLGSVRSLGTVEGSHSWYLSPGPKWSYSHSLLAAPRCWPQGWSPCLLSMNISTNREKNFSEFHSGLSLMHQHMSVCEPPSPLPYWVPFQKKEWILPWLGENVSKVRLQVHKAKKRFRTGKIPSSGTEIPGPYWRNRENGQGSL